MIDTHPLGPVQWDEDSTDPWVFFVSRSLKIDQSLYSCCHTIPNVLYRAAELLVSPKGSRYASDTAGVHPINKTKRQPCLNLLKMHTSYTAAVF